MRVTRPATGARFTWQSKTFMKIADARARLGAEAELGRRRGRGDRRDDAVGGADDQALAQRRHPRRVAEEIDAPDGQDEPERREEAGEEEERQRRRGEAGDEAPASRMHRLDYTRKQRHRPSHSPLACGGDGIFARPGQYRSAAGIRRAARTGRRRRCGWRRRGRGRGRRAGRRSRRPPSRSQDGDQRAADGEAGAVERVDELGACAFAAAEAGVHPAGLEVAADRAG